MLVGADSSKIKDTIENLRGYDIKGRIFGIGNASEKISNIVSFT